MLGLGVSSPVLNVLDLFTAEQAVCFGNLSHILEQCIIMFCRGLCQTLCDAFLKCGLRHRPFCWKINLRRGGVRFSPDLLQDQLEQDRALRAVSIRPMNFPVTPSAWLIPL